MKITYTPNPLDTIVELDEHEIELFRLKLKIEQYEDMMFSAHYALTTKLDTETTKAEAIKDLAPDRWCTDNTSKIDERVEELLQHYLTELKANHVGDCTCVAMSCSKCHAESVLGIDTLKPYPGKHQLHKIASVFSRWNAETQQHDLPEVTLDEAIEKLAAYTPTAAWAGWEAHADRWAREVQEAHQYLLNYRNTHFAKE